MLYQEPLNQYWACLSSIECPFYAGSKQDDEVLIKSSIKVKIKDQFERNPLMEHLFCYRKPGNRQTREGTGPLKIRQSAGRSHFIF